MAAASSLPDLLLWLLPAAFVLHDAEELFFLPGWLHRNRDFLSRRFPVLSRRILPYFDTLTPVKFAVMAAEELMLLSAVVLYARFAHDYYPWLALFLAFGVHLLVHVVQWVAVGRYLPAVGTSLTCLVYCGWGMYIMINTRLFTLREFVFCGVAGCVAAAVNLLFLHWLAVKSAASGGSIP